VGYISNDGVVQLVLSNRFAMVYLFKENEHATGFYSESALTIKIGSDRVKFISQLGISAPLGKRTLNAIYHSPFIFSLGLQFNITNILNQ
jgi:hypothetical protein